MLAGFTAATVLGFDWKSVIYLPFQFYTHLISIIAMEVIDVIEKRPGPAVLKETNTGL